MLLATLACLGFVRTEDAPIAPREFRGAWVATVDNIDWPSRRDLTSAQQREELTGILDTAKRLNLNALVFQVRPHADALYASELEPWSEYLTGRQGLAPSPLWDPLAFMVEEAHKRGIELHAWFNPFRAWHPKAVSEPAGNFLGRTKPALVKQYGKFQWMDPGEQAVQDHSLAVILDVARRYDVDGVHIDDYFYPYKSYSNGQEFPDGPSWSRYTAAGGKLKRDDWRRDNVNRFVRRLHEELKRVKRHVKFGISPFGIYRPGQPKGVKTNFDQYDELYADARKWLAEGWCDYFSPQLYWRIAGDQPYEVLLQWWVENNPKRRHLWPGIYTGQISAVQANWDVAEIPTQIERTRVSGLGKSADPVMSDRPATGNIHYSMKSLVQGWKGVDAKLASGVYARPALVPPSPWLGAGMPEIPQVTTLPYGDRVGVVNPPKGAVFFAVYGWSDGAWSLRSVLGVGAQAPKPPGQFGVTLVDRAGNQSRMAVLGS